MKRPDRPFRRRMRNRSPLITQFRAADLRPTKEQIDRIVQRHVDAVVDGRQRFMSMTELAAHCYATALVENVVAVIKAAP